MRRFRITLAVVCVAVVGFLLLWQIRIIGGQSVTPMIRVPCTIIDAVDGDTLTVEMRLKARVRLKDCWAPEMREPGGKEAHRWMKEMVEGKDGMLEVSLDKAARLDHVFSFGRIVGRVYVNDEDVGRGLVLAGLATAGRSE